MDQSPKTLTNLDDLYKVQVWIHDFYQKHLHTPQHVVGSFVEVKDTTGRIDYIEMFITHHLLREYPHQNGKFRAYGFEIHRDQSYGPIFICYTLEQGIRELLLRDFAYQVDHEWNTRFKQKETT